jgi:hypothetical protein
LSQYQDYPTNIMTKSQLQKHARSLDTSNAWLWMVGKGIQGLHVLQQPGLDGLGCWKFRCNLCQLLSHYQDYPAIIMALHVLHKAYFDFEGRSICPNPPNCIYPKTIPLLTCITPIHPNTFCYIPAMIINFCWRIILTFCLNASCC